jgi:hypothetical protein
MGGAAASASGDNLTDLQRRDDGVINRFVCSGYFGLDHASS